MANGDYRTISALPNDRVLAGLLGDLTVAWSHAERMMYFAFWVATGTTQAKAFDIYETLSGPKMRMDLTLSLFEQDRPDHPKFGLLIEKLRAIVAYGQFRNELIHRTWAVNADGEMVLLNHRMSRRQAELKKIDQTSIEDLLRTLASTSDDVLMLTQEIFPDAFRPN